MRVERDTDTTAGVVRKAGLLIERPASGGVPGLNAAVLVAVFVLLLTGATAISAAPDASPADDHEVGTAQGSTIPTGSAVPDDNAIRERLQAIFAQLDELRGVGIGVRAGVVTLTGSINTTVAEERAIAFAEQTDGVVAVESELELNRDIQPRVQTTLQEIMGLLRAGVAALPLFAIALALVVGFWMAGRWLARRERLLRRLSPNRFIADLVAQLVQGTFLVAGLAVALVLLDATALLGTILGAAGIIGLAVGFAVRDTVENYIASILLSLRNPFEVNDLVEIDEHQGNVVKLTSRATILISPDGNHIRIPNATVFKAVIINYTRHPERRFQFDVGVDTDQDLSRARNLALQSLAGVPGVLGKPEPLVIVETLGDSNVVLRCFAWVDQTQFGFLKVRSEAIRGVKQVFDDAGIVMPEPVFKVRLYGSDAAVAAVDDAPARPSKPATALAAATSTTADVSVDRTIERRVAEEERSSGDDNLLDPAAATEL